MKNTIVQEIFVRAEVGCKGGRSYFEVNVDPVLAFTLSF